MTKSWKPSNCFKHVDQRRGRRPNVSCFNLLMKSTCGLTGSYSTIAQALIDNKPPLSNSNRCKASTREDGNLDLSHMRKSKSLLADRFEYLQILGTGTFCQTIEACDTFHPDRRSVAIKIMNAYYNVIGEGEFKKVMELNDADSTCSHIVSIITTFAFGNHFCLVFERLHARPLNVHLPFKSPTPLHHVDSSLSPQDRRARDTNSINKIRKLASQLMVALLRLRDHRLIHADIKPENVLFQDEASCRVKLIDFGNSFTIDEAHVYFQDYELQSLHFRAPEILLGIPFDYAIDVWSVGILLCEAWLGRAFVRGDSPQRMLHLLIEYLGPIPARPFQAGKFYDPAYSRCRHAESLRFSLTNESDMFKYRLRRLSEALGTRHMGFLRFLNGLLQYDPAKRFTPLDALRDPFLSELFPFDLLERHSLDNYRRGVTPVPIVSLSSSVGDGEAPPNKKIKR